MSVRTSHRHNLPPVAEQIAHDDACWRGRDAAGLVSLHRARTLRAICRLHGLRPAKRRAWDCARAIAQHSADLDMGRA